MQQDLNQSLRKSFWTRKFPFNPLYLVGGLVVLVVVSRPMELWKVALAASMAVLYVLVMVLPFAREYFELDTPPVDAWIVTIIGSLIAGAGVWLAPALVAKFVSDDE